MITVNDCYKAVSDLISESYEWISSQKDTEKVAQYILGLNDMARYLAEMIERTDEGSVKNG